MNATELNYTVESEKSFDAAVEAVQAAAGAEGFRVLAVHDVGAILREKAMPREPIAIVEVCSARHASAVLAEDVTIGSLLPCKVNVYVQDGRTYLSALRPRILAELFPGERLRAIADEVEEKVRAIVDRAR